MADTRRLAEQYMLRTRMNEHGGAVGRPWITNEVVAFVEERIAAARREAFEEAVTTAQALCADIVAEERGSTSNRSIGFTEGAGELVDRLEPAILALAGAKKGGG